jgi:hypothetical protein
MGRVLAVHGDLVAVAAGCLPEARLPPEGRSLPRCNLTDPDPEKLWTLDLHPTQVEQAFKDLQGDPGAEQTATLFTAPTPDKITIQQNRSP